MTGVIYRAAERKFAAWKNSGGETAEILCEPDGAGFDDFHWRISTARVACSGPFSVFAGVQRSLTVIEGGAMRLSFDTAPPVNVDSTTGPISFPGDLACHAELIGAPLLDLNVMVRAPYGLNVASAEHGAPPSPHCEMRYLFALQALSSPVLARHDLLQLPPDTTIPPTPGAMVIDINRQAPDA